MSELELRVSDGDRDHVLEELRAHAAEGRLTVEELEDRVQRALAARTAGELAALTRDLPERPAQRPTARPWRARPEVQTYLAVMALLIAIWALAGAGYFWPVWPAIGWGFFLLGGPAGRRSRLAMCRPSFSSRR
jgi:hypothetical protein